MAMGKFSYKDVSNADVKGLSFLEGFCLFMACIFVFRFICAFSYTFWWRIGQPLYLKH